MDIAGLIPTLTFYVFAAIVVGSAIMVITSKNPVHSVFFLILAFFNSAGLFILIGAEYIAMTLVIVYVGAVAVLFLFVVMMLDINFVELREGFLKYLKPGAAIAGMTFFALFVVLYTSLEQPVMTSAAVHAQAEGRSNTHAIGDILYTWYLYPFQMAGIILLIAMVGAIVLTLRQRSGVRRQSTAKQLDRGKEDGVRIVSVRPGEGIAP